MKQDRGELPGKPKQGLWALLSTMKFAIWILILLGVLSLVAMFVNEFHDPRAMRQPETYSQQIVEGLVSVFQMDDAYRSWWYRLLLGVLCLSLFACILKRFPVVLHIWKSPPPDYRLIQMAPGTIHRDTTEPKEQLLKKLRGWRFGHKSETVWVGEKSRLGMWGPLLTHAGMLLLGIGALVTSFGNFTTRMGGYSGDIVELQGMPFTVQIDSFRVTYYPLQPMQTVLVDNSWLGRLAKETEPGVWDVNRWTQQGETTVSIEAARIRNQFDNDRDRGNIQKFSSWVTIFEDGREVDKTEIAVNDPLRRAGFRFYQSSYDIENPRVAASYDSVEIVVADSAAGISHTLYLKPGVKTPVPDDTLSVTVGRLLPDFKIGRNNVKFSGSDEFINPGLEVVFSGPNGFTKTEWLLLNFQQGGQPGRFTYRLKQFYGQSTRWEMATIFEIKYTYGTSILWLGFLVGTIGLLLSFYFSHRMLYLIWPTEGRSSTFIIGTSRKMPLEFEKSLDRVLKS